MFKAFFCLLFYLAISCFLICAQEISEDKVIAEVNGKKIYYKEIMLSQNQRDRLKLKYKEELAEDEINKLILSEEKKYLANTIKNIVKEEKIQQWHLAVSTQEINNYIETYLQNTGLSLGGITEETRMRSKLLFEALSEYLKKPNKDEEIYAKLEKFGYSKGFWNLMKKNYNTPEKLELIKKGIKETPSSLKENLIKGFKPFLINEKFEDYITKDIAVSEDELMSFYRKEYPLAERYPNASVPKYDEVKGLLTEKLLQKKKEEKLANWWLGEFKQAKIEIKDKRFKDVLYLLIPPEKVKARLVQKIFVILVGIVIFTGVLIFSIVAKRRKRKATPI